jgi:hypothetical protein
MLKVIFHELSSKVEVVLRSALLQWGSSEVDDLSVLGLFFKLKP